MLGGHRHFSRSPKDMFQLTHPLAENVVFDKPGSYHVQNNHPVAVHRKFSAFGPPSGHTHLQ